MMKVYINQAGYRPDSKKTAVISKVLKAVDKTDMKADDASKKFSENTEASGQMPVCIVEAETGRCVFETAAVYFGFDAASGDEVWQADFSPVTKAGRYYAEAGGARSYAFDIRENVYRDLNRLLCKALYFQRCGTALEEKYAGNFARACCHKEKAVCLEDYVRLVKCGAPQTAAEFAAFAKEKEDLEITFFDVSGGWHDAGDFGRYPTAAATALAHILYAWQWFPKSFEESLNIPESGSGMPDILSECLYELRWLLKMQMDDGSVSHKLTSMRHANFVMPCRDKRQMILFPASTMAAADFAAIMALASRIYESFAPDFSKKALQAAIRAYQWLEAHPEFIGFENPKGCNTGGYEDTEDTDERLWAAAELYAATGDASYLKAAEMYFEKAGDKSALGWTDVAGLAGWTFFDVDDVRADGLKKKFEQHFIDAADDFLKMGADCGYGAAMQCEDYGWGSNMVVLNRGMVLATAFRLTGCMAYKEGASAQMDYLLGVNAADFSYVTGAGEHAFKNPHNRVTVADGIEETIPGFVSGGPNKNPCDEKAEWLIEPGTPPMKCYLDVWECYSLNEITIYWNSPAIFLAAFLDSCGSL